MYKIRSWYLDSNSEVQCKNYGILSSEIVSLFTCGDIYNKYYDLLFQNFLSYEKAEFQSQMEIQF